MSHEKDKEVIMVVDDNPTNLRVLIELLDGRGFEVLVAVDGEGAISQVDYARPDLILLDVMMPGIDGFETCRRLKELEGLEDIPIIFMTALSEVIHKVRGLKCGAVDYITKPLQQEEVLARIRTHLTLAHLNKQLKVTNASLKDKNNQLEETLRELEDTQERLVQAGKMASLGRLVGGVAHELKNPLNFITNFSEISQNLLTELGEMLQQRGDGKDDELDRDMAPILDDLRLNSEKISLHGKRANRIVTRMMEHAPGNIMSERRHTDINALLDDYKNYKCECEPPGSAASPIKFQLVQPPPCLEVVPQEIGRVFVSLLDNAFHAIKRKSDSAPPFRSSIRVQTRDLEDWVEITVRDNGIGIPEDLRSEIFEPFFTTNPERVGLGLSLSHDIVVRNHRGTLTVESEEGIYTQFTIRLPK